MQKKRQLTLIMHHSLSAILFPGYRRRVLGLLLLQPDSALHGREIARRTGLPAGTLTRELTRLAQAGLLKREKRGNQMLYSADRASPVFEEVASILRKTSGMADVLADALAPLRKQIRVACIFGSMAQGRETSGSDVDVLIIGQAELGAVMEALHPAQQLLSRDINPKVFKPRQWRAGRKAGDAFTAEVHRQPKIFLIGGEDELAESARHKP
jgi:DNA-binding transcriptional ArsR family regulator